MLIEISCDKFAEGFRKIVFNEGLNIILGSAGGSNALGKSTFLWMIDYAFGGTHYCYEESDIRAHIKEHRVYFTFRFDNTLHYFYRDVTRPDTVFRCDAEGSLIEEMTLRNYRRFLSESYQAGVSIDEITDHFFRIYGGRNSYEKSPLLSKPNEKDDKAVDFLIALFRKSEVLSAIRDMESELGIKAGEWQRDIEKPKSFEIIEENKRTIAGLRERLSSMMKQDDSAGMMFLGLSTSSGDKIVALKKELNELIRHRNQLKEKVEAVKNGNRHFIEEDISGDFMELTEFFPSVNLRSLEEINQFHIQIRQILKESMEEELSELQPLLDNCEKEIVRLRQEITESGLNAEISQRVTSQCVSVSKRIDALEEENRALLQEKEAQEARIQAKKKLKKLLTDLEKTIDEIVKTINHQLTEMNDIVTAHSETAPELSIDGQKNISFGTCDNTSEETAFKSLILLDLALLFLTGLPVLIHDGNLLNRISDVHFAKLLELYRQTGKQVFIAVDRAETEDLKKSTVLKLSEDHKLFGISWS